MGRILASLSITNQIHAWFSHRNSKDYEKSPKFYVRVLDKVRNPYSMRRFLQKVVGNAKFSKNLFTYESLPERWNFKRFDLIIYKVVRQCIFEKKTLEKEIIFKINRQVRYYHRQMISVSYFNVIASLNKWFHIKKTSYNPGLTNNKNQQERPILKIDYVNFQIFSKAKVHFTLKIKKYICLRKVECRIIAPGLNTRELFPSSNPLLIIESEEISYILIEKKRISPKITIQSLHLYRLMWLEIA